MMRSIKFMGGVALALVLGATTYARAEDSAKGTIKSVDTGRREVVIKGIVKDTIYELNKDAAVWLDGAAAKIDDLKADDKITILYDKKGEHLFATSVRALRRCEEVVGTIRTTVGEKKEIVLKGTVKDTTYELNKEHAIWLNGKKSALSDLREGDEVRLTYERRGDHFMTNDVVVLKRK